MRFHLEAWGSMQGKECLSVKVYIWEGVGLGWSGCSLQISCYCSDAIWQLMATSVHVILKYKHHLHMPLTCRLWKKCDMFQTLKPLDSKILTSAGILSPNFTKMISPTTRSTAPLDCFWPSRRTMASYKTRRTMRKLQKQQDYTLSILNRETKCIVL